MILICSNNDDTTTVEVIKWLRHKRQPFSLLLPDNPIESLEALNDELQLVLQDGTEISLAQISAYWYRRGSYRFTRARLNYEGLGGYEKLNEKTRNFLKDENKALIDHISFLFKGVPHISDRPSASVVNKLNLLALARRAGFKAPDTLVTNKKQKLAAFFAKNGGAIITKPIDRAIDYLADTDSYWLPMYTETVTENALAAMPESFFPSLFQQKIDKKYELRIFYFKGEVYGMAIFSQNDPQTAVDFRRYNMVKPNRNIPFTLPAAEEDKLRRFMALSGYDNGSLDLIVDKKNDYYFLEINPVGQFGMTSEPCNYYLERRVAEFLTQNINS